MDNYKEIRKKPNFLYLFFLERGGKRVTEDKFNASLKMWLSSMNVPYIIGKKQIENYLDNKYA